MILHRLIDAARRQSWFTVLVELFVVVVGIYAGLQVDAWQDARADRAEARYYLARLVEELDETIALMEGSVAAGESLIERSARAIGTLRSGSLDERNKPQFDDDFRAFLGMANFYFTISSLSELQATGSFEAIDNRELRLALVNFMETVNIRRSQSELLSDSFGPSVMQLLDHVDVTADFMSGGTILSSPEELLADPLLLRTMVKLELMQVVQHRNLARFLEDLNAMRTTLLEHTPAGGN